MAVLFGCHGNIELKKKESIQMTTPLKPLWQYDSNFVQMLLG